MVCCGEIITVCSCLANLMFCFSAGLKCSLAISQDVLEPHCPINKTLVISNTGILVGEGSALNCLSRHSLVREFVISVQLPEEELN